MNFLNELRGSIDQYLKGNIESSEGIPYSEYKLKKRIYLFKRKHYPSGKLSENSSYRFYYDIITPRVNDELKNVRIVTEDVDFFSIAPREDFIQVVVANKEYAMFSKKKGETEKLQLLNSLAVEDGNVIIKIINKDYEICDPLNIYPTNLRAESIDDTGIVQRHVLSETEIRKKKGIWKEDVIEKVLKECGNKFMKKTEGGMTANSATPFYEIFEYTGEMPESFLFEQMGKKGGSDEKYILGRIVLAGMETTDATASHTLYAADIRDKKMSDFYRHLGRGNYKGTFWREGMYELLFDYQIRANEIGNQIARGLDFASTTIFKSTDLRTISSVKTDLVSGDIIRSADLQQVEVRMQGMDQLIADWNRNIQEANRIANSSEIVSGEQLQARTPFKLGNLMNQNANKYFGLIKDKIGFFYGNIIEDIFAKDYLKELSGRDMILLTGSDDILEKVRAKIVEMWYMSNLALIGPHDAEMAEMIKAEKLAEIAEDDVLLENTKDFWKEAIPRIRVNTVGQNSKIQDNLENLTVLMQYESDPGRRAFLLDGIYATLGVSLPPAPQMDQPQVGSDQVSGLNNLNEQQQPQQFQPAGQTQPNAPQAGAGIQTK